MYQIGQEACCITEMGDLQKIGYGVSLLWILLQGKRIKRVEGSLLMAFSKRVPKLWISFKEEIASGNTRWIDRLCYYSEHVAGSPGYWRAKRAEVYTWINHHIEARHGPPNFFITLSCAEYLWPDIRRFNQ